MKSGRGRAAKRPKRTLGEHMDDTKRTVLITGANRVIASPGAAFVVGHAIAVDGGFTAQ